MERSTSFSVLLVIIPACLFTVVKLAKDEQHVNDRYDAKNESMYQFKVI